MHTRPLVVTGSSLFHRIAKDIQYRVERQKEAWISYLDLTKQLCNAEHRGAEILQLQILHLSTGVETLQLQLLHLSVVFRRDFSVTHTPPK